ncbi:unnamed protein product [Durusdinium trenchii]|uniref:Uncharacterized protein n=1 Tax=Durusdinium trenchii TaxID=1381693 RepID=A0ABP0SQK2_9DINO
MSTSAAAFREEAEQRQKEMEGESSRDLEQHILSWVISQCFPHSRLGQDGHGLRPPLPEFDIDGRSLQKLEVFHPVPSTLFSGEELQLERQHRSSEVGYLQEQLGQAKEAEEREKERISSLLKEARDRYPMLDKPVTSGFMSQVAALSFALAVEAGHGFVVPARTNGQVTAEAAPLQSTAAATAPAMGDSTMYGTAMVATAAAGVLARGKRSKVTRKALHGIKFPYSLQKDTHADLEFLNDVGYLPDGTPLNKAGNCINHPEIIMPDPHTPGSPLPRAEFTNSIGYLPDGTPMNAAGNALNHPETMQPDMHVAGSPLPASVYSADVGYLADSHAPGSPLPRANLHNSIGYLVDGTPMNAAGNCLNHPETMQPDMHAPGSPLPASVYSADVGYLVDGTDLVTAGNNSVRGVAASAPAAAAPPAAAPQAAPQPVAAAFVGSSTQTSTTLRKPAGFLYSVQKDAYVDLTFGNDVGYLPDGTPMNLAGNCMNHPESIGPDPHAPGSPLPRALFVNDVGYLPDGTPMNAAGNAINHPETMGPDPHSPGSPLPPSAYAADIGYLVDGTPLDKAGNNAVH